MASALCSKSWTATPNACWKETSPLYNIETAHCVNFTKLSGKEILRK